MKRKSNTNLSGTQLSKKAKEKAKAVDSDIEPPRTNGKTEIAQPSGRPVAMGIPLKRALSVGGSGSATPTGDTDGESDLAMEDDIKCPHIFGLGDSETEHELEEDAEDDTVNDDDDDSKSAVSTPGRVNGSSDQAGSSSSSKAEGTLDPQDPLQIQGLKWVKTLGMAEKAWVCRLLLLLFSCILGIGTLPRCHSCGYPAVALTLLIINTYTILG